MNIVRRQVLVTFTGVAVSLIGGPALTYADEPAAQQAAAEENLSAAPDLASFRISGPYVHKNLSVYLIHSDHRDDRDYLTLNEGLKSGLVKVSELDEEQVSRLLVENRSEKPLFLQEGDRVTGGKQDRTVYSSLVIAAKSKPQPIPSFCIEPSRWAGGKAFVHNANPGYASNSVRQAAKLSMSQGLVWQRVGRTKNQLAQVLGTENKTTSLNEAIDSKKIAQATRDFQKQLGGLIHQHQDAVGVAFAINGEVLEVNVFPGHLLSVKIFPRLMETYAVDAVVAAEEDPNGAKKKAPPKEQVIALMKTTVKRKAERVESINDGNQLIIFASKKVDPKTKSCTFRCATRYHGVVVHLQWIQAEKIDMAALNRQQGQRLYNNLNPAVSNPDENSQDESPNRQQQADGAASPQR